jgi:hypothetical protein
MAVEGAPTVTPGDIAVAVSVVKGGAKLLKKIGGAFGKDKLDKEKLFGGFADLIKGQRPPKIEPPRRTTPIPARPPQITTPGATTPPINVGVTPDKPPPTRIPDQVGDIFKGTLGGKAAGKAGKIGKDIAGKAGKGMRGGVVGTAVYLGIEAGRAIINAREAQKALEDRQYTEKTKREEQRDNERVREIRRRADEEARRVEREEREKDRQASMARTQARIAARKAEVAARATERQLAREANNRAKAKIEENRQLEAEQKRLDAQQARAAKAGRAAKIQQIRNLASVAGLLYSLSKSSKKGKSRGAAPVATPLVPTAPPVRRTIPGRPAVNRPPAVPDYSFDSGPNQLFTSLAPSKTIVASKVKVKKCVSDTPKRKKGRCRTGFFRETPNKTTYKTWSERKCL